MVVAVPPEPVLTKEQEAWERLLEMSRKRNARRERITGLLKQTKNYLNQIAAKTDLELLQQIHDYIISHQQKTDASLTPAAASHPNQKSRTERPSPSSLLPVNNIDERDKIAFNVYSARILREKIESYLNDIASQDSQVYDHGKLIQNIHDYVKEGGLKKGLLNQELPIIQ